MRELERVPETVEIVEELQEHPEDIWESAINEWSTGASHVIVGQLRQARAAAAVTRVHGTSSMKKFADEVGASKTTVYDYAKVWWIYGHLFEDGQSSLSVRAESGLLNMAQLIKMSRAPDPIKRAEEVEDGTSSRAIEAMNQQEREQEHAEDPRAQTVQVTRACEACGGTGEVPVEVPSG